MPSGDAYRPRAAGKGSTVDEAAIGAGRASDAELAQPVIAPAIGHAVHVDGAGEAVTPADLPERHRGSGGGDRLSRDGGIRRCFGRRRSRGFLTRGEDEQAEGEPQVMGETGHGDPPGGCARITSDRAYPKPRLFKQVSSGQGRSPQTYNAAPPLMDGGFP